MGRAYQWALDLDGCLCKASWTLAGGSLARETSSDVTIQARHCCVRKTGIWVTSIRARPPRNSAIDNPKFPSEFLQNGASSTGRCNTIQSADPQMLTLKNRSVWLMWPKPSQVRFRLI